MRLRRLALRGCRAAARAADPAARAGRVAGIGATSAARRRVAERTAVVRGRSAGGAVGATGGVTRAWYPGQFGELHLRPFNAATLPSAFGGVRLGLLGVARNSNQCVARAQVHQPNALGLPPGLADPAQLPSG